MTTFQVRTAPESWSTYTTKTHNRPCLIPRHIQIWGNWVPGYQVDILARLDHFIGKLIFLLVHKIVETSQGIPGYRNGYSMSYKIARTKIVIVIHTKN